MTAWKLEEYEWLVQTYVKAGANSTLTRFDQLLHTQYTTKPHLNYRITHKEKSISLLNANVLRAGTIFTASK